MQSVTGEIEAGEAQGARGAVGARKRGSIAIFYVVQLAISAGFGAVGLGLGWAINHLVTHEQTVDPVLTMLVGLWLGILGYLLLARRLVIRWFHQRMAARGLDVRYVQTLTVQDEGLLLNSGMVRALAPWPAVTEVFRFKAYWIFLVQMTPWFVPRRFFANEAEERAFLRAALAHLSEEALARSKDAVDFAGA